jgi:hypothetical protein
MVIKQEFFARPGLAQYDFMGSAIAVGYDGVLASAKFCVRLVFKGFCFDNIPERVDAIGIRPSKSNSVMTLPSASLVTLAAPWPAQKLAAVIPGGSPFFRSRSFCGNSGTITASVTAASGAAACADTTAAMTARATTKGH